MGKRGKHPHINFEPTDIGDNKGKLRPIKESKIVVTATTKSGRKVSRKFRDFERGRDHFHKWLRKGHLRNVTMKSEARKVAEKLQTLAEEYDISEDTLHTILERGIQDYNENVASVRPDITSYQWGMARVNSFIHGGRARKLDEDLQDNVTTNDNNQSFNNDVRQRRNKKHARPAVYNAMKAQRPVGMDESLNESAKLKSVKTHKAEAPKPNMSQISNNINNRIAKMQADSRAKLLKGLEKK